MDTWNICKQILDFFTQDLMDINRNQTDQQFTRIYAINNINNLWLYLCL